MTRHTKAISTKISHRQNAELLTYLDAHYPDLTVAEYLRLAVEKEMAANGAHWSEYEFIGNAKRVAQGIPWKVGRPRKSGG